MRKLPKTVYVRWEEDGDTGYLVAGESVIDCIDGDGPNVIGSYILASTDKYEKVVKEVR